MWGVVATMLRLGLCVCVTWLKWLCPLSKASSSMRQISPFTPGRRFMPEQRKWQIDGRCLSHSTNADKASLLTGPFFTWLFNQGRKCRACWDCSSALHFLFPAKSPHRVRLLHFIFGSPANLASLPSSSRLFQGEDGRGLVWSTLILPMYLAPSSMQALEAKKEMLSVLGACSPLPALI